MPEIARRSFLTGSASPAPACRLRHRRAPRRRRQTQGPGVYRYKLGDYQLTALYDGTWYLPIDEHFVRNASGAAVNEALAAAFLPPSVLPITFTALLVNDRQEAHPDRHRHRRADHRHSRLHERQSDRRRRPARRHRHHHHLAFPSRPHRRHQDQGRRQGLRQCRNPGAGAGMDLLDGRRAHEPACRNRCTAISSTRGASSRTSPRRCGRSSRAPRSRPASSRSRPMATRPATPLSPSTPATNRCW